MTSSGDLASALQQLRTGDAAGAVATVGRILERTPRDVGALCLLAAIRESRGELAAALAALDLAVAETGDPRVLAPAWFQRARLLERLERFADALAAHQELLRLSPGEPAAIAGAAACLCRLGRPQEAVKAYDAALLALPGHPDLQFNRARCLETLGRHAEALQAWDACLRARPEDRDVQIQRAATLCGLDRADEALVALDRADPTGHDIEALANRGLALLALGDPERARSAFDRAVQRAGGTTEHAASLRYHRGLSALYAGDFTRAWPDYEHRWSAGLVDPPALDRGEPGWDGRSLAGPLRVWREQPIGDEVLFARLLPLARARAAEVVLECSPRMVPLFKRSFPNVEVRAQGEAIRAAAAQVSIASLGAALGADAAGLAGGAPYLKADPDRAAQLKDRYARAARGRRIVGISWFSNNQRIGRQKSSPLLEWGALLAADLLFVNLQYGAAAADAEAAQARFGCEIVSDPEVDQMADLDAFAAQVAAMDQVVSVSNTTVHFAGALGVPCSVLLSPGRGRLWYWGAAGDRTPWYESVRLHRRGRDETWSDQVAAVAADLGVIPASN